MPIGGKRPYLQDLLSREISNEAGDILDSLNYAYGPVYTATEERARMGLLDELRQMQADRRAKRAQEEFEADQAAQAKARSTEDQPALYVDPSEFQRRIQQQAASAQHYQLQQQAALRNQLGQQGFQSQYVQQQAQQLQNQVSPFEQMLAQQAAQAVQSIQMQTFSEMMAGLATPAKKPAEPAKPVKKTVVISEPGQRKIETDE